MQKLPRKEEENAPSTIHERIKAIRLTYRLTQKKFVETLGITQSYLSAIEHGTKPSDSVLHAISCLYDINYNWLVTGEGEMFTNTDSGKYSPLNSDFLVDVIEAVLEEISDRAMFLSPRALAMLIVFTYDISFKHQEKHSGKKKKAFLKNTASKLLDYSPFIKSQT